MALVLVYNVNVVDTLFAFFISSVFERCRCTYFVWYYLCILQVFWC